MLIIAHRGAGAYSPHNSRQAFIQAINMGTEMIETDVRVTKDNVPVIFHDSHIKWGAIDEINWKDLKKYRLSNGEFLPSLEEILQLFNPLIRFNLEIKPLPLDKLEPILYVLKKFDLSTPLISSFSLSILKEIKHLTTYKTALLIEKKIQSDLLLQYLTETKVSTVNLYYFALDKNLANFIHEHNYKLIIWTDFASEIWNPQKMYFKAYKLGCDGFITGKPDLLFRFLKNMKKFSNH